MHANLLLDPLFWEHVAARQEELLDVSPATRPRGTLVPRGDVATSLGVEPEAADAPEQLRAAWAQRGGGPGLVAVRAPERVDMNPAVP